MPTLLLIRRENQQMLRLITSLSLHWTFETATQSFISPQRRTPTMIMQSINLTDKGLWSMGKLAPKQLCEEFRAGVDGACASNLNSCAKYAGAKSSWKCVGAVANSIEASALPPIPGGDYMEWDTDATLEWWSRVPILPTKGSGSSTLASLRAEYRIEKLIGSCQGKFAK